MQESDVKRILHSFPAVRRIRIANDAILPGGDWFLFETSPRPSRKEIGEVISDIDCNGEVYVNRYLKIVHSDNCDRDKHTYSQPLLSKIGPNVKGETFNIAVWEGSPLVNNNGQPVAFSISPEISYQAYPEHPHISTISYMDENQYPHNLPNSLCYNYQESIIHECTYDVMRTSLQYITYWLFCHQVWLATKQYGSGIWIGPQISAIEEDQFSYVRCPTSPCRCGRRVSYEQCHLDVDFRNWKKLHPDRIPDIRFLCRENTLELDHQKYRAYISRKADGDRRFIEKLKTYFD